MLEHPLAASVQCRMYRILQQGLTSAVGSETALFKSLQKVEGFRTCRRRPLFAGTTTAGLPAFKLELLGWLDDKEEGPLILLQVSYLDAAGDVMRVRRRQVVRTRRKTFSSTVFARSLSHHLYIHLPNQTNKQRLGKIFAFVNIIRAQCPAEYARLHKVPGALPETVVAACMYTQHLVAHGMMMVDSRVTDARMGEVERFLGAVLHSEQVRGGERTEVSISHTTQK